MKFTKKSIFVTLFAILYFAVGIVSTIHAVSFFGLANNFALSIILAITFEIGQAAVLFNLLTSPSQRKRIMPWSLMCILTAVQILGNVFSSYKYLITNSSENLRFFKEPIFTWTDLPDQQCNVIITYIVGAILPIVALCLTEMVVSYLNSNDTDNVKPAEDVKIVDVDKPTILTTVEPVTTECQTSETQTSETVTSSALTSETQTTECPTSETVTSNAPTSETVTTECPTSSAPTTTSEVTIQPSTSETPTTEEPNNILSSSNLKKSHFINI